MIFVARNEKDQIIGYIQWIQKSGFRKESVIELEQIAVLQNQQGKGIGTQLIKESLRDIKNYLSDSSSILRAIIVSTRTDNAAQVLYKKALGAEKVTVIKDLYSHDFLKCIYQLNPTYGELPKCLIMIKNKPHAIGYMMNILETTHLILRTWNDSDLDPMAAIDQDPQVCKYLLGIGSRDATAAGIQRFIKHYNEHRFSLYAVELRQTHDMIGFLGLSIPSFEAHFTPAVEIGWRLASQHWNKGYATEGAKAVLHYAFTDLGLHEIVSFCLVNNQASRRVMEKIGLHRNPKDDFERPDLPKDSPLRPHVLYRLTQMDYLKQQKSL